METNKFGDYKQQISEEILNEIEPSGKKKFISVLKIKYPKEGADLTTRKGQVLELLSIHNKENKDSSYIEMLDITSNFLILGLELPNIYDINVEGKKQVSRYIGNSVSRKLYHQYGWGDSFSNVKNALFSVVEIKKIE